MSGKVAFITGAARGQGRSHAERLAAEGADVVLLDVCTDIRGVPYPLAGPEDLAAAADAVRAHGRRAVAITGDVRDLDAMTERLAAAVDDLGGLDVVIANAGIGTFIPIERMRAHHWQLMIDVNLTGVWNTIKAAVGPLRSTGRGGSVVLTSSVAGLRGYPNGAHYAAAKHGLVGLMQALANELAPDGIRVNTVHPTSVNTPMIHNPSTYRLFDPAHDEPDMPTVEEAFARLNLLPVPWIEPSDVSDAVLWLASDESRFVTGTTLSVDAGCVVRSTP